MWLTIKLLALVLLLSLLMACSSDTKTKGKETMYFTHNDAEVLLEQAINADDAAGISIAIEKGANPNTVGLHGVTPLLMAVGKIKPHATAELLLHGADPQIRDKEKDNPMTLAVQNYQKEPKLLQMLLNAGGDPNTLTADNNPIIKRFLSDYNFDAVRYLAGQGADINARTRSEDPLVLSYGLSEDWDAVLTLLELGADYDYPDERFSWMEIFSNPNRHAPDSPIWPYKVKVWKFLKERGMAVPDKIEDLVDQNYWDWLEEKGLPKHKLE
jgi:hypothetical protein